MRNVECEILLIFSKFFSFPGDCVNKEFKAFDTFYQHLKDSHSGAFNCDYCDVSISECSEHEMQDHLKMHDFAEFQCLHCNNGSNDVAEIRNHMSTEHSSQFLIVASRRARAKMVYIGDCLDKSAFIKYKCKDLNVLSYMDPKLNAHNANKLYLDMLNANQISEIMFGSVKPKAIDFRKAETLIRYDEYERMREKKSKQLDNAGQSKQPSTADRSVGNNPSSSRIGDNPSAEMSAHVATTTNIQSTVRPFKPINLTEASKQRDLIDKLRAANPKPPTGQSAKLSLTPNNSVAKIGDSQIAKMFARVAPMMNRSSPKPVDNVLKPSNWQNEYQQWHSRQSNTPNESSHLPANENAIPNTGAVPVATVTQGIAMNRLNPINIRYDCIVDTAAAEMCRVRGNSYTDLECSRCSTVIKMNSETGLVPYVAHLELHPPCFSAQTDLEILKHRLMMREHANAPIIYMEIQKSANHHIQRLIRCTFVCNMCDRECPTATHLYEHFYSKHKDCVVDARIRQLISVVQSTDAAMPIGTVVIDPHRYNYGQLFNCLKHSFTGSRSGAIQHHLMEHGASAEPFQCQIKYSIFDREMYLPEWKDENVKSHRMYVFECLVCSKYFESIDQASEHCKPSTTVGAKSNRCDIGFMAKKLVACSGCKTVSTFEGIQRHSCIANKIPVNALNRSRCAFCSLRKNDSMKKHYEEIHADADTLSPDLLESLALDEIGFEASFSPGCCQEFRYRYDELDKFVGHLKCDTGYQCTATGCDAELQTLKAIVEHYRDEHNAQTQDIIGVLHSTKSIFKKLPFQMKIILPNGLNLSARSIANTKFFCYTLKPRLITLIDSLIWKSEVQFIKKTMENLSNSVVASPRRGSVGIFSDGFWEN